MFRRRFRMRRHLFLRIVRDVTEHDMFFTQRPDACGKLGFTPIAKCTAAMRILAYGLAFDQVDEYLSIGETTAKDILKHFVEAIVNVYQEQYLRKPNPQDIARLKHAGAERGFPGMLGSVDCMHWQWKNCPAAWKGQYMGRSGKASIILEAVASYDLHIWHAFFGTPGSCNDINVLDRSHLFDDLLNGVAPACEFQVNGNDYDTGYYLTDGIYPEWSAFIPSIRLPRGPEEKHFAQVQESVRKDVERAFGVLQARFHIIRNPVFYWDLETVGKTMIACVILHNMIVEDERDTYGLRFDFSDFEDTPEAPSECVPRARADMTAFLQARFRLRNRANHQQLKNDLIKHVYQHRTEE
jgi:transposon-encoded protein